MVEGARLESVYMAKPYRGFESHSLRHLTIENNRWLSLPVLSPPKYRSPKKQSLAELACAEPAEVSKPPYSLQPMLLILKVYNCKYDTENIKYRIKKPFYPTNRIKPDAKRRQALR